jgi:hypothetical protein
MKSLRRIDVPAILVDYRQRCNALAQRLVPNLRDAVDVFRPCRPGAEPPQVGRRTMPGCRPKRRSGAQQFNAA